MSHAHTLDRIEVGADFEQRLRAAFASEHEARREEAVTDSKRILLAALEATGKLPKGFADQREVAIGKARESAAAYKQAEHAANAAEEMCNHPNPVIAKAAADSYVRAEAERRAALEVAKKHEQAADEFQQKGEELVPLSWVAHVPGSYDAIVEAAILACVPMARALEQMGVRVVKVQIGGHVEPNARHFPFVNAHVWPVE